MDRPYALRPATDNDYEFLYQLATIRPAVEATWGWEKTFQQAHFRSHWDPTRRQIIQLNGIDIGAITLERDQTAVFLALIEIAPALSGSGDWHRLDPT